MRLEAPPDPEETFAPSALDAKLTAESPAGEPLGASYLTQCFTTRSSETPKRSTARGSKDAERLWVPENRVETQ